MQSLKHIILSCFLIGLPFIIQAQSIKVELGKVKVQVNTNSQGQIFYSIAFGEKPVIKQSLLGLKVKGNDNTFNKFFEIIGTEVTESDTAWKPVWGEVSAIRNHHKQIIVRLRQKDAARHLLNIIFRVFEDGVGFRYEIPAQPSIDYFIVEKELTEFAMTGDHQTFWIPGDYDSNEYSYTRSAISSIDNKPVVEHTGGLVVQTVEDRYSVQTPLMMKSADGLYFNIHEAALVNYPAMQLHADTRSLVFSAALVPDALGNKAYLQAPFKTPWRTIIVSNHAEDILSSKLILNLNEPARPKDVAWIKPMKFAGIWWEMQTKKSTWSFANSAKERDANGNLVASGKHGANTINAKRYIDFAAKHHIDGLLIEGWNIGWEDWFGNWKENVFDFVTPYPDFDINAVTNYAAAKGVKLIMHNETSGSATNYERRLDTAFKFMNRMGYGAVKTGYVGRIIPRGEHHDGQWMVNHYQRVTDKAMEKRIMLDVHEMVRPTGLQRTYPNLMASEAGRGTESNAFSNGNLPDHETILPFTRLIGGPMDYTPGIFKLTNLGSDSSKRVRTTLCKQLALYVTMYSPMQMVADLPENYEKYPDAFQYIEDVPVDWDDTKVLEAEPGEYVTIVRKENGKPDWYLGAITNEKSRTVNIPLEFLEKGKKYEVTIYADAPLAHYLNNPELYSISNKILSSKQKLVIKLAPGGGCAVKFKSLRP